MCGYNRKYELQEKLLLYIDYYYQYNFKKDKRSHRTNFFNFQPSSVDEEGTSFSL